MHEESEAVKADSIAELRGAWIASHDDETL
jgi:hypothetical protein